ncbi:Lrp/AsnC family transcriptional regulator for asnA, asnC and gidA [Dysgonomonas sp. PH5-45]|uniref:Lrp/AsnC family transcriptional regulator n=1 Tax=unclassified Dysgonomonas TaxID=2630389 RepID=UPI0024760F25|nr:MULTISPECIES: Lrp/AsnC family transcriptional regulator [unclassified Dysgonomonas]MDH6355043.1 Lrp/AsnC family transcriptional regulator for asnA, asnC and gidA [Dysgonomonas sp. PH5-45]
MKNEQIDDLDIKILKLIGENARIPFLEVARECNVSGAAIHQRINRLVDTGIIKGSRFLFDINKIGYETCAFVNVAIGKTSDLKELKKTLLNIPEIVGCYFTSGQNDMVLKVVAHNNKELQRVIQERLFPLGFTLIETSILFEEVFERQISL